MIWWRGIVFGCGCWVARIGLSEDNWKVVVLAAALMLAGALWRDDD